MNEEFYALLPGTIGTVAYNWKDDTRKSAQDEQAFIDEYTRESMYVLMNKATYSYEDILPPDVCFMKAREDARRLYDEQVSVIIKRETLQVGNKECLDTVLKLQQHPNFKGWVNEQFIRLYIQETQRQLKSQY